LGFFFRHRIAADNLSDEVLDRFIRLDDNDVEFAIKQWQFSHDPVLADLSQRYLSRRLLKIRLQNQPFEPDYVADLRRQWAKKQHLSEEAASHYVFHGQVRNQAYMENSAEPIMIWFKHGELKDLSEATDMPNIHALASPVIKHYLCAPEEVMR